MPDLSAIKKPTILHIGLALSTVAVGIGAARLIGTRRVSAAESLADSLLDTERLRDAANHLGKSSGTTLAGCAAYLVSMAYQSAAGLGAGSGPNDPLGFSRTETHPYTRAVATVLTEAHLPEHTLTYAVTIPDVGEVRGTRRVGTQHILGLSFTRPTPDRLQISLADGYTAQLESDFHASDRIVTGGFRVFGTATLRDNRGNVGNLTLSRDGQIGGTITHDTRVIGRFEGKVTDGLHYKQYQIEPGD
jgi:hypothetical protein